MGGSLIQTALPGSSVPRIRHTYDSFVPYHAIITQKTDPLKTHRTRSGIVQLLFSETDASEKSLYVRHREVLSEAIIVTEETKTLLDQSR